jgi:AcrR family transcriptional regulator
MPDSGSRADGVATRAAILDATLRRLIADGYARLNLRDIAQEAGVNHALINYHFGSKQHLVLAVLDAANRRLLERQQTMYAQAAPVSEKWRRACAFYDDDLTSNYVRLMMELMSASFADETLRREFTPRLLAWHRLIDEEVARTIARHDLDLPVSAQAIGAWIGCFWIGMEAMMTLGVAEADGHFLEAMQGMHALLQALEAGGPRAPRRRARRRLEPDAASADSGAGAPPVSAPAAPSSIRSITARRPR